MYVLDPIYKVNLFMYLKVLQYGFLGGDKNTLVMTKISTFYLTPQWHERLHVL